MTIKPLKVGIIDSGISLALLQATNLQLRAGANFFIDWERKNLNSIFYDETDIADWRSGAIDLDIDDKSGHGTAVSSILYRNVTAPVEFYVAKILDKQQSGSAISLLAALKWLVNDLNVDYVNLSLGTDNWNIYTPMLALVEQAISKQCTLFSAAGNVPTLPSEILGVIAIGTTELAQKNTANVKIDCTALPSSLYIFHENQWLDVAISTSYACPLMLANYCNALINNN
jgi:subtilisin family serine protease